MMSSLDWYPHRVSGIFEYRYFCEMPWFRPGALDPIACEHCGCTDVALEPGNITEFPDGTIKGFTFWCRSCDRDDGQVICHADGKELKSGMVIWTAIRPRSEQPGPWAMFQQPFFEPDEVETAWHSGQLAELIGGNFDWLSNPPSHGVAGSK